MTKWSGAHGALAALVAAFLAGQSMPALSQSDGAAACDVEDAVESHQRLDNMLSQKFDHYVYGTEPAPGFRAVPLATLTGLLEPGTALLFYQLSSDTIAEFAFAEAVQGQSMRAALLSQPPRRLCIWLIDRSGVVAESSVTFDPPKAQEVVALADTLRASLKQDDKKRLWRGPDQANVVMAGGESIDAAKLPPPGQALMSTADVLLPPAIRDPIAAARYDRLLVVPSRNLGSIPFSTLPLDDDRLVVDVASVVILPSFGVLTSRPHSAASATRSLVVGDPELAKGDRLVRPGMFKALPGARAEATVVGTKLGTQPLLGRSATKAAIIAAARDSNLIYFATHGVANDRDPNDRSYLLVSDGALTAREIAHLKLARSRPTVVMSACQTGLGKAFESGVIGLAKAWSYAGAESVVMSLWNVYDKPTRDLMVDFVGRLRSGAAADVALREAMLETRKTWPHPAYWSGFAVYGRPE